MKYDGNFWIALGQLGFMIGIFLLGKLVGVGKKMNKLDNVERSFNDLKDEVKKINTSLTSCQNASAESRGSISTSVDTLQTEVGNVSKSLSSHTENRDLHTDREWRTENNKRIEAVADSLGKRFGDLEVSIGNRFKELKTFIKNGKE